MVGSVKEVTLGDEDRIRTRKWRHLDGLTDRLLMFRELQQFAWASWWSSSGCHGALLRAVICLNSKLLSHPSLSK